MAGVNTAYIANQLGHNVRMLLDVYARWVEGADKGAERRLLAAAMTSQDAEFVPEACVTPAGVPRPRAS